MLRRLQGLALSDITGGKATLKNSLQFLIKLNMTWFIAQWLLLGTYSGEMKTCVYIKTYVGVVTGVLFIIIENRKQSKSP